MAHAQPSLQSDFFFPHASSAIEIRFALVLCVLLSVLCFVSGSLHLLFVLCWTSVGLFVMNIYFLSPFYVRSACSPRFFMCALNVMISHLDRGWSASPTPSAIASSCSVSHWVLVHLLTYHCFLACSLPVRQPCGNKKVEFVMRLAGRTCMHMPSRRTAAHVLSHRR